MISFNSGKPQCFHMTSSSRFSSRQLVIRSHHCDWPPFIKEHKLRSMPQYSQLTSMPTATGISFNLVLHQSFCRCYWKLVQFSPFFCLFWLPKLVQLRLHLFLRYHFILASGLSAMKSPTYCLFAAESERSPLEVHLNSTFW